MSSKNNTEHLSSGMNNNKKLQITSDTPLVELSVGDFVGLLKDYAPSELEEEKYIYGIKGLATFLNCSVSQAMRIKSSGKLDEAIVQSSKGSSIIVDKKKAKEIYFNTLKKRYR